MSPPDTFPRLTSPSPRRCFYFGTFNPVHIGHLMIAQSALAQYGEALGFNRVDFVPAASPPHRQGETDMMDARQRLRLVQLAVADNPAFSVNDIEFSLGSPAYTIDTLKALIASGQAAAPVPMIIGSDALRGLPTWKDYRELAELACFLLAPRPGTDFVETLPLPEGGTLPLMTQAIDMPPLGLSSTWVRSCLKSAANSPASIERLRYFLPDSVFVCFKDR